jgi:NAD+ kinase
MKIALIPNHAKEKSVQLAREIIAFFTKKKIAIYLEDSYAKELDAPPLSSTSLKDLDFFLCMGGDGSILQLVHKYKCFDVPIVGINLGHLGFMADVPLDDLYPSLEDLLQGKYNVAKRIILEANFPNHSEYIAVNDVVIHRGENQHIVEIAIFLDGIYVNTFEADGIIVATPTGSTAYSLAAGGPILTPSLDAIVLTPISAHTISNRPIVIGSNQTIEIQCISRYKPLEVTLDGFIRHSLPSQEKFSIRRSDVTFNLVNLQRRDYFSTLRTKLGWFGKLRKY